MADFVNLDNEGDELRTFINSLEGVTPNGWQNFQSSGDTVTLTTAGQWYDLTNDALGSLTSTEYSPEGVGALWDSSEDRIDVSSLSVGDILKVRIDLTPTTAINNTLIHLRFVLQEGELNAPLGISAPLYYKSSGEQEPIAPEGSFAIFTEDTRDLPVIIQAMSDTNNTSLSVAGWFMEPRLVTSLAV